MKLRMIACVVGLSAICLNAFALEITKGKLVSQRDFTTGVIKSIRIVDNENPKMNMAQRFSQLKYAKNSNLTSPSSFVSFKVNNFAPVRFETNNDPLMIVSTNNEVSLHNDEKDTKQFTISTQVCVLPDGSTMNYTCSMRENVVELDAGGDLNGAFYHKAEMNLAPGHYTQLSSIVIQKQGDATRYVTYDGTSFIVNQTPASG